MSRNILRLPRPLGFFLLAAATTLPTIHLRAQNYLTADNDAPQPQHSSNSFFSFTHFFHPQTSISLGTFAQLTPTRVQGEAGGYQGFFTNGISPTPGVLGTFRQQFRPWLGYSVNMGYTRVEERYTSSYGYGGGGDLKLHNNMYELSLSYVASKQLRPRMTGFVELGAGAITFLPINISPAPILGSQPLYSPAVNFRPEGVGGVGIHVHLANSVGLRVEYRGLLYKDPDFGWLQKSTTVTSEPTVSLTYSFGHK